MSLFSIWHNVESTWANFVLFWANFYCCEYPYKKLLSGHTGSNPETLVAFQEETADNSIGNVTGTTAVNVFLGIGIAWSETFWVAVEMQKISSFKTNLQKL